MERENIPLYFAWDRLVQDDARKPTALVLDDRADNDVQTAPRSPVRTSRRLPASQSPRYLSPFSPSSRFSLPAGKRSGLVQGQIGLGNVGVSSRTLERNREIAPEGLGLRGRAEEREGSRVEQPGPYLSENELRRLRHRERRAELERAMREIELADEKRYRDEEEARKLRQARAETVLEPEQQRESAGRSRVLSQKDAGEEVYADARREEEGAPSFPSGPERENLQDSLEERRRRPFRSTWTQTAAENGVEQDEKGNGEDEITVNHFSKHGDASDVVHSENRDGWNLQSDEWPHRALKQTLSERESVQDSSTKLKDVPSVRTHTASVAGDLIREEREMKTRQVLRELQNLERHTKNEREIDSHTGRGGAQQARRESQQVTREKERGRLGRDDRATSIIATNYPSKLHKELAKTMGSRKKPPRLSIDSNTAWGRAFPYPSSSASPARAPTPGRRSPLYAATVSERTPEGGVPYFFAWDLLDNPIQTPEFDETGSRSTAFAGGSRGKDGFDYSKVYGEDDTEKSEWWQRTGQSREANTIASKERRGEGGGDQEKGVQALERAREEPKGRKVESQVEYMHTPSDSTEEYKTQDEDVVRSDNVARRDEDAGVSERLKADVAATAESYAPEPSSHLQASFHARSPTMPSYMRDTSSSISRKLATSTQAEMRPGSAHNRHKATYVAMPDGSTRLRLRTPKREGDRDFRRRRNDMATTTRPSTVVSASERNRGRTNIFSTSFPSTFPSTSSIAPSSNPFAPSSSVAPPFDAVPPLSSANSSNSVPSSSSQLHDTSTEHTFPASEGYTNGAKNRRTDRDAVDDPKRERSSRQTRSGLWGLSGNPQGRGRSSAEQRQDETTRARSGRSYSHAQSFAVSARSERPSWALDELPQSSGDRGLNDASEERRFSSTGSERPVLYTYPWNAAKQQRARMTTNGKRQSLAAKKQREDSKKSQFLNPTTMFPRYPDVLNKRKPRSDYQQNYQYW